MHDFSHPAATDAAYNINGLETTHQHPTRKAHATMSFMALSCDTTEKYLDPDDLSRAAT
jgi:hypothetical protein